MFVVLVSEWRDVFSLPRSVESSALTAYRRVKARIHTPTRYLLQMIALI